MTLVEDMLRTYPADLGGIDRQKLADCIKECFACAQACTACADACLSEDHVAMLVKCIRTNLDTADIALATGKMLSRHTGYDANLTRAMLEACARACKSSLDVCEQHSSMEHCAKCAAECRSCLKACRDLLEALG
ncbi:hypothetical protein O1R50_12735 [Glycomyces luteolus]|uniref:Four-helix bundle copper-binding protein n=1 Tax=Glycomyces luteolus TaxID=2670330 RepID=A0A9X3PAC0_9ACTN|nr:hypothetical protein [Glycomyces luteolus]MDA1360496.1 hypothetical protein [Glycomyces luteolus]